MAEPDLARVWQGTVSTLGNAGLTAQQRAFLRLARLVGLIDSTALVAVPNDYTKEVLEQRLRAQVTDALGSQLDREVRLAVTVDPSLAVDDAGSVLGSQADGAHPSEGPAVGGYDPSSPVLPAPRTVPARATGVTSATRIGRTTGSCSGRHRRRRRRPPAPSRPG